MQPQYPGGPVPPHQQQQQHVLQPVYVAQGTAVHQMQPGGLGVQTGYMTVVPTSQLADSYPARQSLWLGTALVVIGVLAFIFNAVSYGVGDYLAPIGHGFWCGTLVSSIVFPFRRRFTFVSGRTSLPSFPLLSLDLDSR